MFSHPKYKTDLIQISRLYIITQSDSNHVNTRALWGSYIEDLTIKAHIFAHKLNRDCYKMRNLVLQNQLNSFLYISQGIQLSMSLTDQV